MKNAKRISVAILAVALSAVLLLSGCSAPKLSIGGTPAVAGTVAGENLSTGKYLAYLYNTFYDMYYNQGLYQYAMYGYDAWGQEYTYGEGDDAQKVDLAEYIKLMTKDTIARQEALQNMLKENEMSWNADDLKKLEEEIAKMEKNAYLPLGISDENFVDVYKQVSLNESSLFYGLYGKGGKREVSEADRKAYFEKNFLSYKIISVPLTDDKGSEMTKEARNKVLEELEGYLAQYNKDKNFEAVVDAYNKAHAEKDQKVEASKDEDNRVDMDATQASDEELVKAIRTVDVGKAKVVEYKAGGSTNTMALVLRLDIHKPDTLFADKTEDILFGMKWEDFNKEVKEKMGKITVDLKKSVVKKCSPKNFVTDVQ
ncbi:MAG: hypothetical protein IIW40_00760 [Clostridia bacterium]|nr:hypothetical protein [Clostridia bacterium]